MVYVFYQNKQREHRKFMEKLVTVVITTYKRPKNLKRAIESVKKQTYGNIEIIVIDDNGRGSPIQKETQNIVICYTNITYLVNGENIGAPSSRNIGLENAHGYYISFLDDDDNLDNKKIEKQVKYLELNRDIDYVYCWNRICSGNIVKKEIKQRIKKKNQLDQIVIQTYGGTSSLMFKTAIVRDINGFNNISKGQEWDLEARLALKGYKLGYVNECLVSTNIDDENRISGKRNLEKKIKELYANKFEYKSYIKSKTYYKLKVLYSVELYDAYCILGDTKMSKYHRKNIYDFNIPFFSFYQLFRIYIKKILRKTFKHN